jgi:hypothetical protein
VTTEVCVALQRIAEREVLFDLVRVSVAAGLGGRRHLARMQT